MMMMMMMVKYHIIYHVIEIREQGLSSVLAKK
jgi:hypothetical protein